MGAWTLAVCLFVFIFFFFKQKTAYEMRISDWSSDVCSSDLLGAQLAKDYACTSCHALDDSRLVGPGWGGLHGSRVSLVDGSAVTADDAFLRESILEPDARVAAGYAAGTMPSYAGQRSEERRVGTECVSKCRSRRSPYL